MTLLDMDGPYPFDEKFIEANIPKNTTGNYALGIFGSIDGREDFAIQYVGRSDTDLNKRIKDHIGQPAPLPFTHFKFSTAKNAAEAYIKECVNYHDCIEKGYRLYNEIHPDKPDGQLHLNCPRCNA